MLCVGHAELKRGLTLYSIDTNFNASTTDSFWKHCGKRRNCWSRAISSFPTMFSTQSETCIHVSPFVNIYDITCLFAAELEEPKIGMWDKGVNQNQNSLFVNKRKLTQSTKIHKWSKKMLKLCNTKFENRKSHTVYIFLHHHHHHHHHHYHQHHYKNRNHRLHHRHHHYKN